MPDIVLKDGTGDTQTIEGATALGVDTVGGGIAVFVSKDMIPEGYEHPSTHPASMITGLAPVATGGMFNSLWGKPFFDLPRLEETVLTFRKMHEYLASYICDLPGVWEGLKGETYKINWDGVEYTCICKDIDDAGFGISNVLYFGNLTLLLNAGYGEDTGEPFLFTFIKDYDKPAEVTQHGFWTNDTASTHTVSMIPVNRVKKMDPKYLPDGAATKEYVQEEISKIKVTGGGSTTTEMDILSEQELPFAEGGDFFGGAFIAGVTVNKDIITDEKYTVVWDGIEYDSIGVFYEAFGAVGLGNPALMGIGTDTGEPYCIGVTGYDASGNPGLTIVSADTEPTHTVRIYQKTVTVSTSDPPEFDLTAMGLPALPMDGTPVSVECDTAELYDALGKNVVKLILTANVGEELSVSGIMNALSMGGDYQCSFIGVMSGFPMLLNFIITTTDITGRIVILATAT